MIPDGLLRRYDAGEPVWFTVDAEHGAMFHYHPRGFLSVVSYVVDVSEVTSGTYDVFRHRISGEEFTE